MHFDLPRIGLFFVLLSVIYFLTNILFVSYLSINTPMPAYMLFQKVFLDLKTWLFFGLGVGFNFNYVKLINFNMLRFIKESVFSNVHNIPFLLLLYFIMTVISFSSIGKYELIYTGFQAIAAIGLWVSFKDN